jgi:hypothetical protein
VSPEYVYSGIPFCATCFVPSVRVIVLNPAAPDGVPDPVNASGGHVVAHAPSQLLLPVVSLSKWYSVMPDAFVRMLPLVALFVTFTVVDAEVDAAGDAASDGDGDAVVELLLQATANSSTGRTIQSFRIAPPWM